MPSPYVSYNDAQGTNEKKVCAELAKHIDKGLSRWLRKAKKMQWDYKNIVERRGKLEKIGDW